MKKINLYYLIACLFFAANIFSVQAQDVSQQVELNAGGPELVQKVEHQAGSFNIPFEKWKYPNGLTLIVHEDHSDPIAHVSVTYHVGSARETPGKSGFAHFFEHMMFQGSEHVADEQHFKIISEMGGWVNGTTTRDRTNYIQSAPSNAVETMLWLEADRMGFLVDAVTKEKFEVQRATVKNEKGQNYLNVPYGLAEERISQLLYPGDHPYSWPTIGYTDDLDRVGVEDLRKFFLRWYGPNNAVITVSGDVNPEEVKQWVGKYFGSFKQCPPVPKQRVKAPILPEDRYENMFDDVFLPLSYMVFPTVPAYHRDEPAIEIMASLFGQGRNSLMYKNFIKTEQAVDAGAFHRTGELGSEFRIYAVSYPEIKLNDTEQKMRDVIKAFAEKGISDEDLQRIKNDIKADLVGGAQSVSTKASILTDWHLYVNRPFNIDDELDRYMKVTREDVMKVFNKYVNNRKAAIVNVVPNPDPTKKIEKKSVNPNANIDASDPPAYASLKYTRPEDDFDRSKRPEPSEFKPATVPDFYTAKFDNSIEILGAKDNELPVVSILIEMPGGGLLEGDGTDFPEGTSSLTADMINEGTENYTAAELEAALQNLGSSIGFSGGGQSNSIFVWSLKSNLDETMKLLEEMLFRPAFPEEEFKRIKKQTLKDINNQKKNTSALASRAYRQLIYGENALGRSTTMKSFKKIELSHLKDYYKRYYTSHDAKIVVVGDIEQEEAMAKLDFLKKWENKEVKVPEIKSFPETEMEIYLIDKPFAEQSQIMIGCMALPYDPLGDYWKANIMNFALGGAFNSRINENLREDKGWTYGARSGFGGSKYPGPFTASASIKTGATDSAIVEFIKELKEYREKGITDAELDFTRSALLQNGALNYETPSQKAGFLARILEYDLPADFVSKQRDILQDITKEEVNAIAKKYLKLEKMVIVVVGDKHYIKDPLKNLGYKIKELKADDLIDG